MTVNLTEIEASTLLMLVTRARDNDNERDTTFRAMQTAEAKLKRALTPLCAGCRAIAPRGGTRPACTCSPTPEVGR